MGLGVARHSGGDSLIPSSLTHKSLSYHQPGIGYYYQNIHSHTNSYSLLLVVHKHRQARPGAG